MKYSVRSIYTVWRGTLLEGSPVIFPFDNFPSFYGNQRFITAFTRALYMSHSPNCEPNQSKTTHSVSQRSILILLSHLYLGLPSGLFPTNNLYAFYFLIHTINPSISSSTSSFKLYLAKSTSYKVPCYTVFTSLLSLHQSSV
jgi:hypothetical protein